MARETLFGIPVIVSQYVRPQPVLQVSPDFEYITPECRAEFNAWLLERFGTRPVAYLIDSPPWGTQLVVDQETMAKLKMLANTGAQDFTSSAYRVLGHDRFNALRYAVQAPKGLNPRYWT